MGLHAVVLAVAGMFLGGLFQGDVEVGFAPLVPAFLLAGVSGLLKKGPRGVRVVALVLLGGLLVAQCVVYHRVFFADGGGADGDIFLDPAFFLIWLLPPLLPGLLALVLLCTPSARAAYRVPPTGPGR
ncbi:hypothetical protein [Actinocorallia herbida]|nr:hypothetical protein [Actinocorallia herbida]